MVKVYDSLVLPVTKAAESLVKAAVRPVGLRGGAHSRLTRAHSRLTRPYRKRPPRPGGLFRMPVLLSP